MSRPPSHRDPREESHYMAGQDALNRWNEFGLAEIECTDVPPKQMVRSFCITNKQLILSTNDDVTYAFQFTPEKSFYSDSRTELTPLKNIRLLDVRYGLEHQAFLTLDGSLYLLGSLAFLGPFDESVAGNEDEDTIFKYYYVSNEAKLPQLAWRKTMGVIKAIRCGDYFTAFMAEINHNQHRVIVFGKNPYFQFHTNHKKVMWYVTEELDVNDPVAIEAGSCFLAILKGNGQIAIWYGNNRTNLSACQQIERLRDGRLADSLPGRIKPPGKFYSLLYFVASTKSIKAIACCSNELIILNNEGTISCYGKHTFQKSEKTYDIVGMFEKKVSQWKDVNLGSNQIVDLTAHGTMAVLKAAEATSDFFVFGTHKLSTSGKGKRTGSFRGFQPKPTPSDPMKLMNTKASSYEEVFYKFCKEQTPRLYHLKQVEADYSNLSRPGTSSGSLSHTRPTTSNVYANSLDNSDSDDEPVFRHLSRNQSSYGSRNQSTSSGTDRARLDTPRKPNKFDFQDIEYFNKLVAENRNIETWNDYKKLQDDVMTIVINLPGIKKSSKRVNKLAKYLTWIALPSDIQVELEKAISEDDVEVKLSEMLKKD